MKNFSEFLTEQTRPTYARITLDTSKVNVSKSQATFFLKITKESDSSVVGYEVDKDGDEIVPKGGQHDRRLRIITKDLIKKRVAYRMNNTYATLEPA